MIPAFPMSLPANDEDFIGRVAKVMSLRIKCLEIEKAGVSTAFQRAYGTGLEEAIAIVADLSPAVVNAAAKRMLEKLQAEEVGE